MHRTGDQGSAGYWVDEMDVYQESGLAGDLRSWTFGDGRKSP